MFDYAPDDLLRRRRGVPFYSDEEDITAPPEMSAPAATATVADDGMDPYRQRIRQTSQAFQDQLERMSHTSYEPPHHGWGYRLAEGVTAALSPHAADAIFEAPDRRKFEGYQANVHQQQTQAGALQNAASDAMRDYQYAEQGKLRQAQVGWYNRRENPNAGKVISVNHNGQRHHHQFDDETNRYDIEAGDVADPIDHSKSPFERYLEVHPDSDGLDFTTKAGKASREGRAPTSDETRINLYRSDPNAFRDIYGDKGAQVDARILAIAKEAAKDPITGEIDVDRLDAEYDRLVKKHGEHRTPHGVSGDYSEPEVQAEGPNGLQAPAGGPKEQVKYYQGHPYVKKGNRWVLQKPAANRNQGR